MKFKVQDGTVTFTCLVTSQTQGSTPCMTVAAVGVPNNAGPLGQLGDCELDVNVPFIRGCAFWYVTARWDDDRQAYRIVNIQSRDDENIGNWTNRLQLVGWVTKQVNDILWQTLGLKLRPNPRITEHVLNCARERRVTLRDQLGAIRYHKANGVATDKAIQLVLGSKPENTPRPKPKRHGFKGKRPNNSRGHQQQKHQKKKRETSINRAFAGLNV